MIKMNETRLLILDTLDVLQKYSDKDHTLTQKEIRDILEDKYGYDKIRPQTFQSNLGRMIEHFELNDREIRLAAEDNYFDQDIEVSDEKERRITDIYYQHKISDPELLLIIDSILFSNQIPVEERENLIKKLEALSSRHFNSRMGNISSMPIRSKQAKSSKRKNLFDNIKEIDRAITEARKISFKYNNYLVEGNKIKLETRKTDQGKAREYIINPYHMAASNGRYYLICNNERFNNLAIYRIDRITDMKILDSKRKPMRDVEGLGENFNLNDFMAENIYMFGKESEYIQLSFKEEFLDELLDWFNPDHINIEEKKDGQIFVRVKSDRMAMRRWALRYALYVRVLSPPDLADEIKEDLQQAVKNYN